MPMLDNLKKHLLRSKLFIRLFFLMMFPLSLGRASGGLRLLLSWLSLHGQLTLGKFSL